MKLRHAGRRGWSAILLAPAHLRTAQLRSRGALGMKCLGKWIRRGNGEIGYVMSRRAKLDVGDESGQRTAHLMPAIDTKQQLLPLRSGGFNCSLNLG
jgi:hypothetical protein